MPCTRPLDTQHSVTIRSDHRLSGGWDSTGDIFMTGTGRDFGVRVRGEGRTLAAAEERAFRAACDWCLTRGDLHDPDS